MGGIQIIKWSNVEKPGFRNVKITNIKIKKDELFHVLLINVFFYLVNDKVSEIQQFRKFKLTNILSDQGI